MLPLLLSLIDSKAAHWTMAGFAVLVAGVVMLHNHDQHILQAQAASYAAAAAKAQAEFQAKAQAAVAASQALQEATFEATHEADQRIYAHARTNSCARVGAVRDARAAIERLRDNATGG